METLSPTTAHVWSFSPSVLRSHLATLRAVLNDVECARADRFHFAEDRERFMVAHGGLRYILASYLHQLPEALVFAESEFGKPLLRDGEGLAFNLSHSGDVVLVAVTAGSAVGVDVEQHRTKVGWEGIAKQVFSVAECAELGAIPANEQLRAFFDAWARKEAFIKALGLGFSYATDAFSVPLASELPEACAIHDQQGRPWSLHALDVPPGYSAALVTPANAISDIRQAVWQL